MPFKSLSVVGIETLSDEGLVNAIKGGEEGAFVLLMRRFNRPLYRVARSVLKDDTEAEDALQDAYVQVFRNIESFRGSSSLRTWLTRIVLNESIARSRKTARRATVIDLHGVPDEDEKRDGDMEEGRLSEPEKTAMRSQVRDILEKSIDALPESFRTVFVLRALEEMNVDEVAACLDIPEATVRTRYFRARNLLRQSLSSQLDLAFESAFCFDGERCDRIVAAVVGRLVNSPDDRES